MRGGVGAPVHGRETVGSDPGRDDDPELPAPSGASRTGAGPVRGDQGAPGGAWLPGSAGDDRGRDDHRGTLLDAQRADDACEHARSAGGGSLLHGGEEEVWADSGYRGIERWVEAGGRDVRWTVAMAPGRRRLLDPEGAQWRRERAKASVRAKGEHPFLYLKRHFGYREGPLPGAGEEHRADRAAARLLEPPDGGSLCDGVAGRRGGHPARRDGNGGSQAQNARCSRPRAPSEAGNRPGRRHSARHRPICRPVQTFPSLSV